MSRYVIKFHKDGYVKYTSHLDILRMFKRSFKKTGIALKYSQGFNPHPKLGFAQPLSLGYSSKCELLEVETKENYEPSEIMEKIRAVMPEGLNVVSCVNFDDGVKSLAAEADSAQYTVWIPLSEDDVWTQDEVNEHIESYLKQEKIIAMKRQKKTKKLAPVDIRKQIRAISAELCETLNGKQKIVLHLLLDCGSTSNLSPELLITTFCEYSGIETPRHEIDVERTELFFTKNLHF